MLSLYKMSPFEGIPLTIEKFPAGETHLTVGYHYFNTSRARVRVLLKYESNDDLWNLALLVDALRRTDKNIEIELDMPYFPYARQDRVCNVRESLSVSVVASFINSLGFAEVRVLDPHSDVVGALVNNIVIKGIEDIITRVAYGMYDTELVSPDAGANKKVAKVAKHLGKTSFIRADKERNTLTGALTGAKVYSPHLGKTDLFVIDDICDGGGTFILLAEELRKITTGDLYLYVSHGIFSKGLDELLKHYKKIYCANIMNTKLVKNTKLIEVS